MNNTMNELLINIKSLLDKKHTLNKIHKNIIKNSLVYKAFYRNSKEHSNYHTKIHNLSKKCFPEHYGGGLEIWFICELNYDLVAILYIDNRPCIWNVCRNPDKKYIGFGIGEELIKCALAFLKSNGYTDVYLYADQNSMPIGATISKSRTKFYENIGFILTGEILNGSPVMKLDLKKFEKDKNYDIIFCADYGLNIKYIQHLF